MTRPSQPLSEAVASARDVLRRAAGPADGTNTGATTSEIIEALQRLPDVRATKAIPVVTEALAEARRRRAVTETADRLAAALAAKAPHEMTAEEFRAYATDAFALVAAAGRPSGFWTEEVTDAMKRREATRP